MERGGSWMNATQVALELHARDRDAPENRFPHRGFRLALELIENH